MSGSSDSSRTWQPANIPAVLPVGLVERARSLGSASIHEAAKRIGALPAAIKPIARSFRIAGPAFTVWGPPRDNLWIHRALVTARSGDVLVVYTGGFYEAGYWGEIMSTAATQAKLAGLVIDACVRDGSLLENIGFPVFARGLAIQGTLKDFGAMGVLNRPVLIGNIVVNPGDLLVGDEDGVVSIQAADAPRVIEAAATREKDELRIIERLKTGESTLDVYDLHRAP
jgi:4-hydroxy-4-methyl-2-oxoglutarate aldolase